MDSGHQRRPDPLFEFRHRGVPDGDHSPGRCRHAHRTEIGVGRPQHEGQKYLGRRAVCPPPVPQGLETLAWIFRSPRSRRREEADRNEDHNGPLLTSVATGCRDFMRSMKYPR